MTRPTALCAGLLAGLLWIVAAAPAGAVAVTYDVIDAPLNATLSADYEFTFRISGISNPKRSGSLQDAPLSSEGDGTIVADWGTPRGPGEAGDWSELLEVAAGDLNIVYEDLGGTQDDLGFGVQGINFNLTLALTLEELTLTFEEGFTGAVSSNLKADVWPAFDQVGLGIEAKIGFSLSGTLGNYNTSITESTSLDTPFFFTLARTFDPGEVGSQLDVPNLAGLVIPVDDFRIQIGSCPIPLCNGVNIDVENASLELGTTSVTATSDSLIPLAVPEAGRAHLASLALGLLGLLRMGGARTPRRRKDGTMHRTTWTLILGLALAGLPGSAAATILGVDDGTILTVTNDDELVIRDIGSDTNEAVLDDDYDWQQGGSGEYRSIAWYTGDGTADTGAIITIGSSDLKLIDLATDTQITLDDDIDWKTNDGFRGIAAYTGDGTPDTGTIVATTNGGDLRLYDLATNSSILLDDDRNWSGSSEHAGIAAYTGDGTEDNGTILYSTDGGLYLRDLATDTSTLLDDDLVWGSNKRRGIASYAAVPEPGALALAACATAALLLGRRRS